MKLALKKGKTNNHGKRRSRRKIGKCVYYDNRKGGKEDK
jgi:hypothetical protein